MDHEPQSRTRQVKVVAQDPSILDASGRILRETITIPDEELEDGPTGYRLAVIDYDASSDSYYKAWPAKRGSDPYAKANDRQLLHDPGYHCFNVYALVMRTLARFEFALGRRISWGFYGHQLKVAPHAFADANAFYSERDHALLFGYFPRSTQKQRKIDSDYVFTALSHDVIVHETTHALLDGLRERYTDPSSPDQAAFHEGFADVVALLSIFSMPAVVGRLLDLHLPSPEPDVIDEKLLTVESLRGSLLFGLAKEVGQEIAAVRWKPLRSSLELVPNRRAYRNDPEFAEPHRRGELLVAAMMNALVNVWSRRLTALGRDRSGRVDRSRVVEEGARIADILLTSAIRALDYAPPVDVLFGDYLAALLTGDQEIRPDDERYALRAEVRASFASFGITTPNTTTANGTWHAPDKPIRYDRVHFEPMRYDYEEVFHFIWENRDALALHEEAYTRVLSVRPVLRIGPDGFALRETVAEYHQTLTLLACELPELGIEPIAGVDAQTELTLYGGGTLIFDEYGRLKYHVSNSLLNKARQRRRLEHLWKNGELSGSTRQMRFATLHRFRALGRPQTPEEKW